VVKFGEIGEIGPLTLEKSGRVLNLWLPSGRALHYINPRVREVERLSTRTGKLYKTTEFLVEGVDQKTHPWGDIVTHGSKIFENVVQAICRDILGYGMIEADKRGFPIVLTCHDEIVAEVDEDSDLTYKDLESIMSQDLKWCPGFMIGAAGFETTYYRKE
jgi:DNA polymerase